MNVMKQTGESGRRWWRRTGAIVAVGALGLALMSCSNKSNEKEVCELPVTVSDVIPGDPEAKVVNGRTIYKRAIILSLTDIPAGVEAVQVKYKTPKSPDWTDTSQEIDPDLAATVAMYIGPGDVVFGEQFVADPGSPACDTAPKTTFSEPITIDTLPPDITLPKW